ncbi:MAG: RsmD family RNA methyltransferase [Planctomycetales bacterium]|nr:RsmD family RNA methyltransferase [Planctomycetales bacterium]
MSRDGIRITGGSLRGRVIRSPDLPGTRPLLARVRVALFDLLGGHVEGRSFLDLFSGTGVVGLEALSRGARPVAFVESSRAAAKAISDSARGFGVPAGLAVVVRGDVLDPASWVQRLPGPAATAFVGTPYRLLAAAGGPSRLARALTELRDGGGIAEGARVIVQEEAGSPGVTSGDLGRGWIPDPAVSRTYGRTRLSSWRVV